jgi:acyl-[acyl-carrier-protein]-phospholipid O-acyltransferase/long-chain-fatty-acid--[acyl-carrier-protein] ligase
MSNSSSIGVDAMQNVEPQQATTVVTSCQSLAPDPSSVEDARGGVFSLAFLALVATQFCVSLNDNIFRWLLVPIGGVLLGSEERAVSLGGACLTLPFILFAALAGYLADRFSKRNVMIVCKATEIAVIVLGVLAIRSGNVHFMFFILFLLGSQAAMFVTSKLGAIPELVRPEKITSANGLINMVSMTAMIGGGYLGGLLYDHMRAPMAGQPLDLSRLWVAAMVLLGVALAGWCTSLAIGRVPVGNPARRFPWNPFAQTLRDFGVLVSDRSLFLPALGSAYFWWLGMVCNMNVYVFTAKVLFVEEKSSAGILLGILTIGIGVGAMLAGLCSRGRVELGLVPFGSAGIALTAMLLAAIPGGSAGHPAESGYYWTGFWLLMLGLTAGLYDIPLQSFLQERSRPEARGSVMAAYNFLAFAGMLAGSGTYWVLSGPLGLSPRMIFFVGGLVTLPATFCIIRLLPYQTTRMAVRMVVRCLYRLRVEGQENVPASGGVLLAANHVSWADALLIGLVCPRRPRMVAYAKYFEGPWLGWFGRMTRIIPIGTTRKSMAESIRAAREALEAGELVCIFPEGGITRTGKIEEFRPGFLSILKDRDVPVVPVCLGGLWGSIFSFERGKFFWKWPRCWPYPVSIRFGRPINRPESARQIQRAVEELACQS